jgi:ribosomal protein S15P/S13E
MGDFFNPIDKDKTTETPHLLPYAHHVGSAIIKPLDKGRTKGNAMTAMYQQTGNQLTQIKEQVETLIKQAQAIHDRIEISEKIYKADMGFKPTVNQIYHLYERQNGDWVLSLVSPTEWGSRIPYHFIATVQMLADSTWDILEKNKDTVDLELS